MRIATQVVFTNQSLKDLGKIPVYLTRKLMTWVQAVEKIGTNEVRKIPGYHDEPLKGERRGQRSIRLNRAYRAIYEIRSESEVSFVSIEEVSKHAY